jgi:hypothetical protein
MPRLASDRAEGFGSQKKARGLVRPLDVRPVGFDLDERAWRFFQDLRDRDGQPIGLKALRAECLEAMVNAEKAGQLARHALTYRQPPRPKRMTAEEAWWSRDLDVWEGISKEDFFAQWNAEQGWSREPTELERMAADEKAALAAADLPRVETDPGRIMTTPPGERVGPVSERIMAWRARRAERAAEALSGPGVSAQDAPSGGRVTVLYSPQGVRGLDFTGDVLSELTPNEFQARVFKAWLAAHLAMVAALIGPPPEGFDWAYGPQP